MRIHPWIIEMAQLHASSRSSILQDCHSGKQCVDLSKVQIDSMPIYEDVRIAQHYLLSSSNNRLDAKCPH